MSVAPPDSAPAMGLYVTDPARAVVEFGLLLRAAAAAGAARR
jgi:hypothetical protein